MSRRDGDLNKESVSGTSEVGFVNWNICDRCSIQASLGSGSYFWKWEESHKEVLGRSSGGLLWSGDAKLIIFSVKDTLFSLDAQGGGLDFMEGKSRISGHPFSREMRTKMRYWQVSVAFSQQIGPFCPYLGITENRTEWKISPREGHLVRLQARHVVGPFGGCTLSSGEKVLLNLEWRSFFEEGFSALAQIRF